MSNDETKARRRKAVRTAIILGLLALAFFVASFIFLPEQAAG